MRQAADAQASRLVPRAACLTRLPGNLPGNLRAGKIASRSGPVRKSAHFTETRIARRHKRTTLAR